jgi:hypothetical protein
MSMPEHALWNFRCLSWRCLTPSPNSLLGVFLMPETRKMSIRKPAELAKPAAVKGSSKHWHCTIGMRGLSRL